jgi:transposase
MPESLESKAKKRMSVIMQVEAGLMTAKNGAAELGISREAYYTWANRALAAMSESLEDRPVGRPAAVADPEKKMLEKDLADTKADLDRAIFALDIKKTLEELRREENPSRTSGLAAKKNTKGARKRRKH